MNRWTLVAMLSLAMTATLPQALHAQGKETCKLEGKLKSCEQRMRNLTSITKSDAKGNVVQWALTTPDRTRDASDAATMTGLTMMVLVPHSTAADRADAFTRIIRNADAGADTSILLGDYRWKGIAAGRSFSVMAVRAR